jgi:moderate conductance mechanosensitive channel
MSAHVTTVLAQDEELGRIGRLVLDLTENETAATVFDVLVGTPLRIALILVLAVLANRLARRGIRRLVARMQEEETLEKLGRMKRRAGLSLLDSGRQPSLRRSQRAESIGALLRSTTTVVIWAIAILSILDVLGLPLGPLLAGAGIVGIAVGFGAQNLVRDFLSGVFMLLEDQFGVGDIIDAGEATGVVEGISLRTTRLRDIGGTVWHIPNGEILRVGNLSQEWARAVLDVEVGYGADVDEAAATIGAVAAAFAEDEEWRATVLEEPEVWGVEAFGPSGLAIRLVVKTTPFDRWNVMRELRRRIKIALDEAGIEIPFPQRDLHLRSGWERGELTHS